MPPSPRPLLRFYIAICPISILIHFPRHFPSLSSGGVFVYQLSPPSYSPLYPLASLLLFFFLSPSSCWFFFCLPARPHGFARLASLASSSSHRRYFALANAARQGTRKEERKKNHQIIQYSRGILRLLPSRLTLPSARYHDNPHCFEEQLSLKLRIAYTTTPANSNKADSPPPRNSITRNPEKANYISKETFFAHLAAPAPLWLASTRQPVSHTKRSCRRLRGRTQSFLLIFFLVSSSNNTTTGLSRSLASPAHSDPFRPVSAHCPASSQRKEDKPPHQLRRWVPLNSAPTHISRHLTGGSRPAHSFLVLLLGSLVPEHFLAPLFRSSGNSVPWRLSESPFARYLSNCVAVAQLSLCGRRLEYLQYLTSPHLS